MTRKQIIGELKQQGKQIAAVLPIHYPRELLAAHDIHPVEMWGPPGVPRQPGEKHVQSYICSIVRNALSFLLSGGLDLVDLILVPHTCDSLQGFASLLLDYIKPKQTVLTLYLPRGQRESDIDFLAEELKRLNKKLEAFTGKRLNENRLEQEIDHQEEVERSFTQIEQQREQFVMDDRSFYSLLRKREYCPPEQIFGEFESAPRGHQAFDAPARLLLSGIVPEPMDLFTRLNELGARVVGDDLACLSRRRYPSVSDNDPWRRMARRIVEAPPCPTRGSGIRQRLDYLRDRCRSTKANGILFYLPKFCEPELFHLPQIRKGLQQVGIPSLVLEIDLSDSWSSQQQNRVAAFIEMMQ